MNEKIKDLEKPSPNEDREKLKQEVKLSGNIGAKLAEQFPSLNAELVGMIKNHPEINKLIIDPYPTTVQFDSSKAGGITSIQDLDNPNKAIDYSIKYQNRTITNVHSYRITVIVNKQNYSTPIVAESYFTMVEKIKEFVQQIVSEKVNPDESKTNNILSLNKKHEKRYNITFDCPWFDINDFPDLRNEIKYWLLLHPQVDSLNVVVGNPQERDITIEVTDVRGNTYSRKTYIESELLKIYMDDYLDEDILKELKKDVKQKIKSLLPSITDLTAALSSPLPFLEEYDEIFPKKSVVLISGLNAKNTKLLKEFISSAFYKPGDKIKIKIELDSNSGILTIQGEFTYVDIDDDKQGGFLETYTFKKGEQITDESLMDSINKILKEWFKKNLNW